MKLFQLSPFLAVLFFSSLADAQTMEVFYSPQIPRINVGEAKTELLNLLKVTQYADSGNFYGLPKSVLVFDDRFELTFKKNIIKTLYFKNLINRQLEVIQIIEVPPDMGWKVINLEKLGAFQGGEKLNELSDYLYYFQYQQNIPRYDSLITAFKPIAARYCASDVKPPISEEQRKYIVQANSYAQEKHYLKAIELYNKAIESDQTAYPAAYSNLALLSAQVNKFPAAIYYMKKYLLLEPEAADARSSQDIIYEWETKIGK